MPQGLIARLRLYRRPAVVMAAGFLYLTSIAHWDVGKMLRPMRNAGRVWTEPASAAGPSFAPDEQNNIDIYKSCRDSVVNITSVVYRQDFFLQCRQQIGFADDAALMRQQHLQPIPRDRRRGFLAGARQLAGERGGGDPAREHS